MNRVRIFWVEVALLGIVANLAVFSFGTRNTLGLAALVTLIIGFVAWIVLRFTRAVVLHDQISITDSEQNRKILVFRFKDHVLVSSLSGSLPRIRTRGVREAEREIHDFVVSVFGTHEMVGCKEVVFDEMARFQVEMTPLFFSRVATTMSPGWRWIRIGDEGSDTIRIDASTKVVLNQMRMNEQNDLNRCPAEIIVPDFSSFGPELSLRKI